MADASPWPSFEDESLGGDRTWSATFDSYDQYHDVAYFAIRIQRGGNEVASFTVQIGMDAAPTLDRETIRAELARCAAGGQSNTDHVAYVLRS